MNKQLLLSMICLGLTGSIRSMESLEKSEMTQEEAVAHFLKSNESVKEFYKIMASSMEKKNNELIEKKVEECVQEKTKDLQTTVEGQLEDLTILKTQLLKNEKEFKIKLTTINKKLNSEQKKLKEIQKELGEATENIAILQNDLLVAYEKIDDLTRERDQVIDERDNLTQERDQANVDLNKANTDRDEAISSKHKSQWFNVVLTIAAGVAYFAAEAAKESN